MLYAAMPRCGRGGGAVLGPPIRLSPPPPAPCTPVAWVVGGFSSPPCPCPSSLGSPLPVVVAPGVLSPRGNSATPGVSVPCGDSTPPPTPWRYPREFSTTPEASRPPSYSPTPGDSWATLEALWTPSSPCTPEDLPDRFPSGLQTPPFAPAVPHDGPPLPPSWQPRRRLSQCQPLRPSRHPNNCPRRFPASPLPSLSAVRRPIPPPLYLSHLHLSSRRLIPHHSIRSFRLRSFLQTLP